ncbi:MAG: T9SS type A sorting domain-containing protein [Bacteroidetes bacterium]|nr:T9SS type A sorting domain-containing protein [Bacteroidota bacterium]
MMKFYPNPATSVINFEFQRNFDKSYSLQIFNFMGKKVYELKTLSSRININLDEFYRGIYIFQLRDKNGSIVESGKFQVNK